MYAAFSPRQKYIGMRVVKSGQCCADWWLIRLVGHFRSLPGVRITSLTVFQGRLFQGTSTCTGHYDPMAPPEAGRVFAMGAGKNVSFDDDLGAGWKHLAVIKDRGSLRLFVNGELQATSAAFTSSDYDITNTMPLLIGAGALNYFSGTLDDIRFYGGALSTAQVLDLCRKAG